MITEIDEVINAALAKQGITRTSCLVSNDKIILKEFKTKIHCVVVSFLSSEELSNGLLRIESLLYFCSQMKSEGDFQGDINPKLYDIAKAVKAFKKDLKSCALNVQYPNNKNRVQYYQTTGNECGIELSITFDLNVCS